MTTLSDPKKWESPDKRKLYNGCTEFELFLLHEIVPRSRKKIVRIMFWARWNAMFFDDWEKVRARITNFHREENL